jgi:hypothetical protein
MMCLVFWHLLRSAEHNQRKIKIKRETEIKKCILQELKTHTGLKRSLLSSLYIFLGVVDRFISSPNAFQRNWNNWSQHWRLWSARYVCICGYILLWIVFNNFDMFNLNTKFCFSDSVWMSLCLWMFISGFRMTKSVHAFVKLNMYQMFHFSNFSLFHCKIIVLWFGKFV